MNERALGAFGRPGTFAPGALPRLKEHVLPATSSFIGAWFLEELTVCDGMLEFFTTCEAFERAPGVVGSMTGPRLDKKVKDSIDLHVDVNMKDARLRRYIDGLYGVIEMYKQKYRYAFTSAPWTIEPGLSIQQYPPGGGFVVWHTERTGGMQHCVYRHLAFMTYLNDVDEGGETEFFYQNVKVQPRKGLTMLWPADWTHTHRGVPAPKEPKAIVTGWLKFL
jgi:2OG-Fe(II) oxygenase superfamily